MHISHEGFDIAAAYYYAIAIVVDWEASVSAAQVAVEDEECTRSVGINGTCASAQCCDERSGDLCVVAENPLHFFDAVTNAVPRCRECCIV